MPESKKKVKRKVQLQTVKRGRPGEIQHMPRIVAGNYETTLRGQRCENAVDVESMLKNLVAEIQAGNFEYVRVDESHAARQKRNPGRPASADGRGRFGLKK